MGKFHVVPAFDYVGEARHHCRALRKHGLSSLLLVNEACVADYSGCADKLVTCSDLFFEDAIVDSLKPFAQDLVRFAAIHDRFWPAVLGAAARLGIPFPTQRGQINCRIKPRMRSLLRQTFPVECRLLDVHSPFGISALAALSELGPRYIAKPIWGQSGDYVRVFSNDGGGHDAMSCLGTALLNDCTLRPFFDGETTWNPRSQLLVEEFLPGREFSLEGFIQENQMVPLMIQEKFFWAESGGLRFETANLAPTPFLHAKESRSIEHWTREVLQTLELNNSFFHLEFKWNGQRFSIIEVNPRLGGGSVPRMLNYWFGIDVRELEFNLQMGTPIVQRFSGRKGFLLGTFVSAPESGIVDAIEGIDLVRSRSQFAFDTRYLGRGQAILREENAMAGREAWMYGYDAFYWCHDTAEIPHLHHETQDRVHIRMKPADPGAINRSSCA
ncbi:MAG TPA: ATP-grasp domain-containing protein [Chthoniobacterales bacterium]|nr:ATP-grasp domain-containing protein [Chthoniobacterales bacterium]